MAHVVTDRKGEGISDMEGKVTQFRNDEKGVVTQFFFVRKEGVSPLLLRGVVGGGGGGSLSFQVKKWEGSYSF